MTSITMFVSNRFISAGLVGDAVNGITFSSLFHDFPGPCIREGFGRADDGKKPQPTFYVLRKGSCTSLGVSSSMGHERRQGTASVVGCNGNHRDEGRVRGRGNAYAHLAR